jgi:hypothetical protein
LDKSTSGEGGTSKKSKKAQEAAAANNQVAPMLQAEIKAELSSAQEAAAEANGKADQAARNMFQLYANLLSVDAKFTWNKIVHKQTTTDTYTDLQGCTKKGPRGLSCKLFDNCTMFPILSVFPNNAAEQELYYITNVLKKPQHMSICQFMQYVEHLNSYISQLPCWYYSWQDQFNLHEKGLNPMDMHSLLQHLEAIERICTQERSNAQSSEKASTENEEGNKQPGMGSIYKIPKKACSKKHCNLCKKHGGTYTMHNTQDCCRYKKNGNEKSDFQAVTAAPHKI